MLEAHASAPRGSASPIQKKMSHVTMVLGVNVNLKSRFTIVPPKKTKLPPGPTPAPRARSRNQQRISRLRSQSRIRDFGGEIFGRKSGDK